MLLNVQMQHGEQAEQEHRDDEESAVETLAVEKARHAWFGIGIAGTLRKGEVNQVWLVFLAGDRIVSSVAGDRTQAGSSGFPSTAWTMVIQTRSDDEGAQLAMEKLCAIYWPPLYAFARRSGCSRHDAEDATQAFFAKMIGGAYLESAREEKGRLRSFLLACFKRFLSDERDKARAQKRGGGKEILSIDGAALEEVLESEKGSPEVVFDRSWAHAVLETALADLEKEYREKGKEALFHEVRPFLTDDGDGYRVVAERLEMRENAVGVAVFRLRKRFGELMRWQVMATVADESEIEGELRHLMQSLG